MIFPSAPEWVVRVRRAPKGKEQTRERPKAHRAFVSEICLLGVHVFPTCLSQEPLRSRDFKEDCVY